MTMIYYVYRVREEGIMFDLLIKIASVIATIQGIRYTEAKIKKIKLENKILKRDLEK